ncbi:MAG: hypothetical protein ACM30E_04180 [Nitrososphaerales archaeon]
MRQFGQALGARWRGPDERDLAQVRRALPDAGWRLFRGMPRSDQVHAIKVWAAVKAAGQDDLAVGQAALLHDVAKHLGGVTLLHRVAVVLIKAFAPAAWRRLRRAPEPSRRNLLYPLWAHANHPATSARLAAEAGCRPEAVSLIRRHQDSVPPSETHTREDSLLLALQRADDDN